MVTRRLFIPLALSALLLAGCQQPKSSTTSSIGIGRLGAYGFNNGLRPLGQNKLWGVITNQYGDQAFWQELYYFTYPQLSGSPDGGVGFVSSSQGQSTGVFFTGNARAVGGSVCNTSYYSYSNLDSLSLEIDIYDDKVAQFGPIAHPYTSGSGSIQAGYVTLNFQDSTSLVTMNGQIQGQMFYGQISYANQTTGQQARYLGDFQVPTNGFFQCQ
jgi:hypothetical protein